MHQSIIQFAQEKLSQEDIEGNSVLELGALDRTPDLKGTLRHIIIKLKPREYVGVDLIKGPCVDVVCRAEDILQCFGANKFDVIISTEMLEHTYHWKPIIENLKAVCKPGGILFITARSAGFAYHACPFDFWRYSLNDMRQIFSDFNIEIIKADPYAPGVFVKTKKPYHWIPRKMPNIPLYSIITKQQAFSITFSEYCRYLRRMLIRGKYERLLKRLRRYTRIHLTWDDIVEKIPVLPKDFWKEVR